MNDTIHFLFSGDFAPLPGANGFGLDPFQALHELLCATDVHITNLECPLTSHAQAIDKTGPTLKAKPDSITLLKQAGVSIACMANNHIFDYGEKGITDTLKICHENEINTLGIVNRADNHPHWLVMEIKGKKCGFLNYCEHEFSVREPGLLGARGYTPVDAYYDISKLKPHVDFLIVIYHGGNEYYPLPNPDMKKDFFYLADLGADAVIGHHTHVYSGYEYYKGKPLVYSLGNFFFPYPDEPKEWHEGVLCTLEIDEKTDVKFHPIIQCLEGFQVNLPPTGIQNDILQNIEELSEIISDKNLLSKYWNEFVATNGKDLARHFLYPGKLDKILLKLKLIDNQKYKRRSNSIKNIVRCNAIKTLLIKSL